jgi:hypothetical protein
MNEIVEQAVRARTGDAQAEDRVAFLIKHELEELAGIRQQSADSGEPA